MTEYLTSPKSPTSERNGTKIRSPVLELDLSEKLQLSPLTVDHTVLQDEHHRKRSRRPRQRRPARQTSLRSKRSSSERQRSRSTQRRSRNESMATTLEEQELSEPEHNNQGSLGSGRLSRETCTSRETNASDRNQKTLQLNAEVIMYKEEYNRVSKEKRSLRKQILSKEDEVEFLTMQVKKFKKESDAYRQRLSEVADCSQQSQEDSSFLQSENDRLEEIIDKTIERAATLIEQRDLTIERMELAHERQLEKAKARFAEMEAMYKKKLEMAGLLERYCGDNNCSEEQSYTASTTNTTGTGESRRKYENLLLGGVD